MDNAKLREIIGEIQRSVLNRVDLIFQEIMELSVLTGRNLKVLDPHLPGTIAEDVFLKLYRRKFQTTQGDIANPKAYFRRVIQREFWNRLSLKEEAKSTSFQDLPPATQQELELSLAEEELDVQEGWQEKEQLFTRLKVGIERMKQKHQDCVELLTAYYLSPDSTASIAENLGIQVKSLHVKLTRCRGRLKKTIDQL